MASCSSPPKKRPKLSLKFMRKDRRPVTDDDAVSQREGSARVRRNSAPNGQSSSTSSSVTTDPLSTQTPSSKEHQLEVSVRCPPPPFAGLQNLGNTCYLNSVLQALRFCPGFCPGLDRLVGAWERVTEQTRVEEGGGDEDPLTRCGQEMHFVLHLKKLYDKMSAKEADYISSPSSDTTISLSPDEVLETVRDLNPMFQGFLQHDSQELLCCLLSYVLDACQKLKKQLVKLRPPSPLLGQSHRAACIHSRDRDSPRSYAVPESGPCVRGGQEELVALAEDCRGTVKMENMTGMPRRNGKLDVNSSVCDQEAYTVTGEGDRCGDMKNGKATPRGRARNASNDSVMNSTTKSLSLDGKTNGNMVNGFNHSSPDSSETTKVCNQVHNASGKKKRLGKFRMAPSQQTLFDAFTSHKKEVLPPNGLRKDLENGTNGQGNGVDGKTNGLSESCELVDHGQTIHPGQTNESNKTKAQSAQPFPGSNSGDFTEPKMMPSRQSMVVVSQESPSGPPETGEMDEPTSWAKTTERDLEVIRGLFQGALLLRTRCNECENYSERREEFQDISLPVRSIPRCTRDEEDAGVPGVSPVDLSLSWAISEFACVERLTDDNKYFCEHCHHHAEAERSMLFGELPPVLTIHLKRFSALSGFLTADSTVSKVNDHLATPLSLCLSQWCAKQCQQLHCQYNLCAVVMHSGVSSSSGHYITYVRIPDCPLESYETADPGIGANSESSQPRWGKFDDEKVSLLTQQELAASVLHPVSGSGSAATPYLLFYRQVQEPDID
ncbi:ubiquitin carboxyl-terminal hydrolase 1-like [Acanthaster planci]|uniref:Ubiquitin carboxyl-terminal hydrolase n=1 Tax=Acanthaster planci TaxID=133434 RepID=A0A8B7YH47_ACAPL|nr:ubiquitin carboxyl-terminal hydrolase 1-like [Acanthaster planci]